MRGIFNFHNLDMKVHNNYPVVEEQLVAVGEQEEPGLLARADAVNGLEEELSLIHI